MNIKRCYQPTDPTLCILPSSALAQARLCWLYSELLCPSVHPSIQNITFWSKLDMPLKSKAARLDCWTLERSSDLNPIGHGGYLNLDFFSFKFLQPQFSSTSNFVNFKFCQLQILSTSNFFNFKFHQLRISSTLNFFNFKYIQLQTSSTSNFNFFNFKLLQLKASLISN